MKRIRMIVFAATVVCLTPMYVHLAHWPDSAPSYLSAAVIVTGLVLLIANSKCLLIWTAELMLPGLLSIRDGIGSMLIWASRRMRHLSDRMFTAGFRMLIVGKVGVREEV